jgi:AcrR family transcriptional regulator
MIHKKSSAELLAASLNELLESYPFEKITVSQIASNCGVAKRTFYYHFRDKYDLALWSFTHQLEEYYASYDSVTFSSMMHYSIEVVWKDRIMLRNIINYTGQNNFRQSVSGPMVDLYERIIHEKYGDRITPAMHSALEFYCGGQIAYAEAGLAAAEIPDVESTFAIFKECAPEIFRKYFQDPQ